MGRGVGIYTTIIIHILRRIVGVDINDGKFPKAVEMGATECVNSMTCEGGDVKVGKCEF